MNPRILVLALFALGLEACKPAKKTPQIQPQKDPILATIGNANITVAEFKYVYEKNALNKDSAYLEKSLRDYLSLYTKFKLKVIDAQNQGIDTTAEFKSELNGYEEQLALPYLKVKDVNERLVKEAYARLGEEVNASHILIRVLADAEPKDTLAAYQKIKEIREKALKNTDFGALARQFSQDPSAQNTNGNLGYFSALQMVYPFEQMAFQTPKGQISEIVRTNFGYHILKVNDRRPNSGKIRVAHLMLRTAKGASVADSIALRSKIFEIHKKLKNGEKWETLCSQFSEDNNSKSKNGELPEFSIGTLIPEFEEVAFNLKNKDDVSEPVLTAYGWHIIKLISKKQLEPFSDLEPLLTQKITRDSRSDVSKQALLQKLYKENNFNINKKNLEKALAVADTNLLKGDWKYSEILPILGETIVSFQNPVVEKPANYTVKDFFEFVRTKQAARKDLKNPQHYAKILFDKFADDKTIEFERKNLVFKYPEYKMLYREYREGMMLFQLMNDKVWAKAIRDTVGARKFYEENKARYQYGKRATVVMYDCANESVLKDVRERKNQKNFPIGDIVVAPVFFEKNSIKVPNDAYTGMVNVAGILSTEPTTFVEIGGHIDGTERVSIASDRIKSISEYILGKGGDTKQIIKKDYGRFQPLSRTDLSKNRRVSFQFFSTSRKTLEKQINKQNALNLKITETVIPERGNSFSEKIQWKVGEQVLDENGRKILIDVLKVEEPRGQTYEEAKGQIVTDYQAFLEKQWLDELKQKYPLNVVETEFQKLVKK